MQKTGRKLIALLLALALILSDGGIRVWADGVEFYAEAESAQTENAEEAASADTETAETAEKEAAGIEAEAVAAEGAAEAEAEATAAEKIAGIEADVTAAEEAAGTEADVTAAEEAAGTDVDAITAEKTTETEAVVSSVEEAAAADTGNGVSETGAGAEIAAGASASDDITWVLVDVYDDEAIDALLEVYRSITSSNADTQASDSVSAERVEQLRERLLNGFLSYEATVDLSDADYTFAECVAAMRELLFLEYRVFYVGTTWGYNINTNTGIVRSITPNYLMEEDEVAPAMAELEAVICEIVNAADESWSDMEIVLYLNDYLGRNCEYDTSLSDFTAYGALVEHTTVCQGYTMAFYTLAKRLGLTCGTTQSSTHEHIWNYVLINGSYYYVDVTFDDPLYGGVDFPGRVSHNYLLKSSTWLMADEKHCADDWTYVGDNADEMSEDSFMDTSYDEYFWDGITQGFEYIDGYWYAMYDGVLTEYLFNAKRGSFTAERTVLTVGDKWYVWDKPGYWSSLASYDGILYYSTPTFVYAYDLKTDSATEIYALTGEKAAEGYIYGIIITLDGTLKYCLSTSCYSYDITGVYTALELDTGEYTEIGSCTIKIDDSDLVYSGSPQLPGISIKDGFRTLVEGLDYVAASFDNVNGGEKELYIVGIGDYTGTVEESFIILYEAPEMTSIYNGSGGVVFTFDEVDGVGKYRVYRRESASDAWESIGWAPSSPCRDSSVESGKTYYYALQYYTSDYKKAMSVLSDVGSEICYLAEPALSSHTFYSSKIGINWEAVEGAAIYVVFYKTAGSSWTYLGYTTSTSYTFADAQSGESYYFGICAMDSTGNYTSYMATNASSWLFLSGVDFTATIAASGMQITWSKVTGAGGYYIYRQADGESSSTLVKTVTSGSTLSWTDTSVASGTTYTYYVNAYYGSVNGAKSSATLAYIGPCSVSYVCNTMDGLKAAWNEVQGASGYYIYRRNNDGTYSSTPTAYVSGGSTTNWTDTSTLTGGKDYTYKVAACGYASTGSLYRGTSGTTKTCKYLKGGEVTSAANTSSGPKVTWTKVSGANGYYVYRCVSGGDYELAATVSGTSVVSWTDTSSLTSGKNYTYKVAPFFKNSSNQVTKGGAKTTKTVKYLTAGKISSLSNTSGGIYMTWSKVTGATGYYIYRKTSSAGSYTLVKTITSVGTVSYTDTTVKSSNNVTYTYYVMPYFKSSAGVITKAGYTTKTTVRLVATSVSSLTNSASKKMTVKWATKSGVTGYQIQYSTSSSFASGNKTVTVTGASSASRTISSLTKGKTYYVRIRTYKTVNGTNYYSAWSSSKSVKISK